MDGTGEHHLKKLSSEGQKSHVLPHMWMRETSKCSNIIEYESHEGETVHWRDRAREGKQNFECG
jgi:hypothetical protein